MSPTLRGALPAVAAALVWLLPGGARVAPAAAERESWPMPEWSTAAPAEVGMDAALLEKARDYALKGEGSGYVVRRGRLVLSWGDPRRLYDLKSSTKSFGAAALGLAIADGKMKLTDKAVAYQPSLGNPPPENLQTGWIERITIFHLATQTAGFDKPGGYTKLLFEPGTKWSYSDGGPNWLAECITLIYKRDVADLMRERLFAPLGIRPADLTWRRNSYRPAEIEGIPRREFGSGISANVDAMARFGLLHLREGRWQDRRLLSRDFVVAVGVTPPQVNGLPVVKPEEYGQASNHYGLLWWNNNDGTLGNVPRDTCWTWGLGDSLCVVIRSLDIVVARAGKAWPSLPGGHYAKLAPFLDPVVASVSGRPAAAATPPGTGRAPYPPSPVIASLTWAPAETIVRRAPDSDNWPMTWADDGHLYTAYGDGCGFGPKTAPKLSLGLARVEGPAETFAGVNLPSPTIEQRGGGASGKKASGILCIRGTLYLWVRNAANSQLAWSADHGQTWTWAPWRFTTSFGCPTFLNFGKDYAGARDEYVYVYSFDSDSAYVAADRMVLARVPAGRITEQEAYEYFVRLGGDGRPEWTPDIARRGPVFEHKGRCYRSGISYNAGLKRYLWWQVVPGGEPRFKGGFGVYDAPEPWGPWTTACFTEQWDVGPGESGSFPTKWMSADGRTLYLVSSTDDSFAVRRATLELKPPAAP
ncbi:MAG: serine hydrolase [Planctomycetes bacterium]|nr:serine hydrolase [Planctomycetota bacterium]